MKKTTIVIVFSFYFFSTKAQDTLWLKSGKIVEGYIVSFANKNVSIKTGNETSVYKLDEIKSLTYNGPGGKSKDAASFPIKTETGTNRKDEIVARPTRTEQ